MCLKRVKGIISLLLGVILALDFGSASSQEEDVAKKLREIREQFKTQDISSKVNLDDLAEMTDFILGQEKGESDISWVRNLFSTLLQKQGSKADFDGEKGLEGDLKLRGVVVMGETACALIDDKIVKQGEMINDMKVEKIEMGKVILKKDKQEKTLYLD